MVDKPSPEFVFELVERANDRFFDRLEGLNAVLVGELAATLGIAGIVIDKYDDLGHGMVGLALAYVTSVIGLVVGNIFRRPPDAPHPIEAIVLLEKREDGLERLVSTIARHWVTHQWLRRFKVAMAGLALVFLTLGTVAALYEKVVESHHGDNGRGAVRNVHAGITFGDSGGPAPGRIWDFRRGDRPADLRYVRSRDRTISYCHYAAEIICLGKNRKPRA